MEPLVLKPRQPVEDEIDCWDDDGDLEGNFEFSERGNTEQDDVFSDAGGFPELEISRNRRPSNQIAPNDKKLPSVNDATDDFEQDLQFPDDGEPLKLPTRKEMPKTPLSAQDDFEEWAEGSLGTRFGGTRRDGRSHRSSSLSGMSPSISSSFTAESEDEGLDGLVLPDGPLRLDEALKNRKTDAPSEETGFPDEQQATKTAPPAGDDFFSEIEVGDGDVFDSGKQTLNRNIKQKKWQPSDSSKPLGLATMFSNKAAPPITRIPRPTAPYERAKITLEPVSESGPPMPSSRRPRAGTGGHSAQSSASSIAVPSTPSSSRVATSSTATQNKELGTRPSIKTLRDQPNTSGAQMLKMKRSLPIIRGAPDSPAKAAPSAAASQHRAPTRADSGPRSGLPSRPKTPLDRSGAESSLGQSRKPPFLSAGTSQQSHHAPSRTLRHNRRWDSGESNGSNEHLNRPASRLTRASRTDLRSPSPSRRKDVASESLATQVASKRTITRPTKTRRYGDGQELDLFEDLPTSGATESKFTKAPNGRGLPKVLRAKNNQVGPHTTSDLSIHPPTSDRSQTPQPPPTPRGQARPDFTPRFARDTNASRNAREQRTASSSGGPPLAAMSNNWKAHIAARGTMNSPAPTPRSKRRHVGAQQQKPHLIKPLGDTHMNPKSVKGMSYNPTLYRWEGNENALAAFSAAPAINGSTGGTPKPALISNLHTASPSVQVVGGMVFDPERMRWLKLSKHQKDQQKAHQPPANGTKSVDSPTSFVTGGRESAGTINDDAASIDSDDPFADVPDLDDRPVSSSQRVSTDNNATSQSGLPSQRISSPALGADAPVKRPSTGAMGSTQDEWLVGEEFDVGPEFIRRQREEEDRWRRKVGKWIISPGSTDTSGEGGRDLRSGREEWRWAIRDLALSSSTSDEYNNQANHGSGTEV